MTRMLGIVLLSVFLASNSHAVVIVDQPHDGTGTLYKSSWYPPDGLDGDAYCWDNFTLGSNSAITEIHWRGGYELHPSGGQSPVYDFEISIYRSITGNTQPDLGAGGRLAHFSAGGNAGETPAGSFGGVSMYDYAFTLPSPFQAAAGTTYWVQIEAWQGIVAPSFAPDWGLAAGTHGNASHFRFITAGTYQTISGDLAFSLAASAAPTVTIAASASPAGAGTITGAGAYPIGSTASLLATPNAGWGFLDWNEAGVPVSTNPNYSFTANVDRALVANFDTSYSVVVYASPPYAGTASGGGGYTRGSTVTVTAAPNPGFVFDSWSDGSVDATHTFPAMSDLWITAFFQSAPTAATFDFDGGPGWTSLPLDWTVNHLTGHFTGNFSVQAVGTLGISPIGFSGMCLWPNSVFASDLGIDFSEPLTDLSVLVATTDLVCDVSSRMRVTAYSGAVFVGTNTVIPPQGSYPSATLSISVATGFDRVVVHWDAPGSLCQDYAPIFLADIVTVNRLAPVGVGEGPGALLPRLIGPAPNPFQDATMIRFVLPRTAVASLEVFDISGRLVRTLATGARPAGSQAVRWDGADSGGRRVGAGVYLLRLETMGARLERRVIRLR
jgi:flagellar hook capping protein FlgD/List-Bact-rpt repeat protein